MISSELVAIFTRLQAPGARRAAADELAIFAHVAQVLVFARDDEIGLYLPATGLPQTLRQGERWQAFLGACASAGSASGMVPDPRREADIGAHGITDRLGSSILVFLGAEPDARARESIGALLPLLGAALALERSALAADGHAAAARDSSRRAGALNAALDINRRELQTAYERAERELVFRRAAESKLRDADRRKDEFLAMLAHELRNPLAPISMAAQILKIGPPDDRRLQQTCQIIDRQISHMTSLLDDLLDVSRVTRGLVTLDQQLHDMRAIVADAIEQARPLIDARRHSLTIALEPEPMQVLGDGTRLVQIVTNLLNNASKYTPPGGQLGLALEAARDHVDLTVSDNGIGIDAGLLAHVFDLFTQGERSADRAQGGLGLGLALVKSLAERHGGSVSAHSRGLGLGSQFVIRLPRAAGAAMPPGQPDVTAPLPAPRAGLSIMIVDDNADAARTLAIFLEAAGHKVRVAFDGRSALDMAPGAAPRVLLLDIGLPDIDGYQLARRLRGLPQTAHAIFIALTGYGQPDDKERSRLAGFDFHLTKPVDAPQLASLLAAIDP
jgi:signal transduction histidine kinase